MAIHMKVIFRKEKLMARESITGQMAKSMMENGARELRMAMACGKVYLETAIWVNGLTQKLMDMEYINGYRILLVNFCLKRSYDLKG